MTNPLPNDTPQAETMSRSEARAQRRAARHALVGSPGRSSVWLTGIIMIVLGFVFLLRNLDLFRFPLDNWWALFIFIPAIGAFGTAWQSYRNAGNQLNATARSSLFVGLMLTLITTAFLFKFNWVIFGPALIILAGIGIIINAMLPHQ
ncbi:MAG: hypothetical protein U0175_18850 [Caldilineaceae bacterium]